MDAHRLKGTKMTQGIALVLQLLIFLNGAGSSSTTIVASSSEPRTSSSLSRASSSRIHTSGVDHASSKSASASSSESVSVTASPILAASSTALASTSATPSMTVQGAISTATATGQSMTVSTRPSLDSATSSTLQPSSSPVFLPSSTPSTVEGPVHPWRTSSTLQPSSSSVFLPSSTRSTVEGPVKPVFVQISFSMLWLRFCSLTSLFTESLSQVLIAVKDGQWQYLSTRKIKLMNRDEKCLNRSHFDQEAVLKFYISYSEQHYGQNDTDNKRTEEAYKILDSYWKGDTIVLLDRLFADKVTKVERCEGLVDENKARCSVTDKYTEAERVGIGIGVGFAVIVLVLVVIKVIKRFQTTDNGRAKPGDTKRVVIVHEENRPQGSSTSITNQGHPSDEPEEIEIHKLPPYTEEPVAVVKGQDEMPLLSAVRNKPGEEITEGVPGGDSAEKTSDDPTNVDAETPSNPEEEGTGERRPTFTSSMTIVVTPDANSTPTEYEFPTQDDDDGRSTPGATKPDLSQLRSSDDDPNQGFINHAFESQTDKQDPDEETKF